MDFSTQPENQLLERHLAHFADRSLLIMGECEESAPYLFSDQTVHIHSTQFVFFERFQKASQNQANRFVSFGVFPELETVKNAQTVIYYWSKSKQQSLFQLMFLMANLAENADLFVVGENRSGINSIQKMLKDHAIVNKLDSARRSSLYYVNMTQRPTFNLNDWWHSFAIQDPQLLIEANKTETLQALPGVFSQKHLDEGSALLIKTLFEKESIGQREQTALDVGCGCGVIAKLCLQRDVNLKMTAIDVDAMALDSARHNLSEFKTATVQASDLFSTLASQRFDLIVSNPPFHQGQKTDYSIVERLIAQAKSHLTPNGRFYLVANHFLPYEEWFETHFNGIEKCAETTQFKVYRLTQNQ